MAQFVDFGSGASKWTAPAASDRQGGRVELRLGCVTGKLVDTLTVPNIGGDRAVPRLDLRSVCKSSIWCLEASLASYSTLTTDHFQSGRYYYSTEISILMHETFYYP
jgi:hypothetical protein